DGFPCEQVRLRRRQVRHQHRTRGSMTKQKDPKRTNAFWLIVALISALAIPAAGAGFSLIEAVKAGNVQAVRTLLKQRTDVNSQEADGMTALHWAVRRDDTETSQVLIRAGANANAANRYGVTPLSLAATNGNAVLVEMLLKAGADANATLPEGE